MRGPRGAAQVKHVTSGAPSAVVFTPQAGTLVAAIATAPSRCACFPALSVLAGSAHTLRPRSKTLGCCTNGRQHAARVHVTPMEPNQPPLDGSKGSRYCRRCWNGAEEPDTWSCEYVCSPYLFVLATNATTLFGPPVDVHAVLKATNEVVHSFVINKAAGGPAVVP